MEKLMLDLKQLLLKHQNLIVVKWIYEFAMELSFMFAIFLSFVVKLVKRIS